MFKKRSVEVSSHTGRKCILFLTIGSLTLIWSALGLVYLIDATDGWGFWHYVSLGFLLTGVVLVTLGAMVGKIARAAREAELPPEEAVERERPGTLEPSGEILESIAEADRESPPPRTHRAPRASPR